MGRYASETTVSAERSLAEIERAVGRYGADGFGVIKKTDGRAAVMFEFEHLAIKIALQMPPKDDPEFTQTPTGRERSEPQAYEAWEKATRQRWRALLLVIKAKLEAVDAGISTIEREFMPFVVCGPNGQTLGDVLLPQLKQLANSGRVPKLLPMLEQKEAQ